jgi:hypothetical protein
MKLEEVLSLWHEPMGKWILLCCGTLIAAEVYKNKRWKPAVYLFVWGLMLIASFCIVISAVEHVQFVRYAIPMGLDERMRSGIREAMAQEAETRFIKLLVGVVWIQLALGLRFAQLSAMHGGRVLAHRNNHKESF